MIKFDKKIILYAVLITVAVLFLGLYLRSENKIVQLGQPSVPSEKVVTNKAELEAKITDKDGEPVIAVSLKPISESFTLSAFTIKGVLTHSSLNSQTPIEKNSKLNDEAWSFPIFRVAENESGDGKLVVEIAAFRLGNAPYVIDKETVIFYVPIQSMENNEKVIFTPDPENTKFFASDAVTEVPVSY